MSDEQKYCGLCAVDDPPTAEEACCHVTLRTEDGYLVDEDDLCQYHTDCFKAVSPMLGDMKVKVTPLGS